MTKIVYRDVLNQQNQEQRVPREDGFEDGESVLIAINTPESVGEESDSLEVNILTTEGWPETRTVTKLKCIDTPFGQICTDLPVVQSRTCQKKFLLIVTHPDIDSTIENAIRNSIAAGAAVAIPILLSTGNIAAAVGAFYPVFVAAAKAEGIKFAAEIAVKLDSATKCGDWRNIT